MITVFTWSNSGMVFLEEFYAVLLLAHLFATIVLVGSMTHNLLIVVGYLSSKFSRQKLEWLYVKISLWAYIIVYIIGAKKNKNQK